jgi:hypothetical protein
MQNGRNSPMHEVKDLYLGEQECGSSSGKKNQENDAIKREIERGGGGTCTVVFVWEIPTSGGEEEKLRRKYFRSSIPLSPLPRHKL